MFQPSVQALRSVDDARHTPLGSGVAAKDRGRQDGPRVAAVDAGRRTEHFHARYGCRDVAAPEGPLCQSKLEVAFPLSKVMTIDRGFR